MKARDRSSDDLLREFAEGDLLQIGQTMRDRTRLLNESGLDPATFELAEFVALVAVDAPPEIWDHRLASPKTTLDSDRMLGALIAVAPIVGSSRVVSAAANIVAFQGAPADDEET